MDIYLKRRRGKILLLIFAVLIGVSSLLYTNWLTKKMAQEERNKVELWADAMERMINMAIVPTNEQGDIISNNSNAISPELDDLTNNYTLFLSTVTGKNSTIPIIVVASNGSFEFDSNIKYAEGRRQEVLSRELKKMKTHAMPITINLPGMDGEMSDDNQLLYYRESSLLRNLKLYPFIQLFVIIVFIVVAYFAFSATQRAEQNQVWVGMSKETAHQLGTPISSLMAWIELLKLQNVDENIVKEFEKDTRRLEKITERFSKIGSKPELLRLNLVEVLNSTISYLKTRSSDRVEFKTTFNSSDNIETPLNSALFSWVIENLCKNAIDAMGNEGKITVNIVENGTSINLDISDTGKGVPKSQFKTIFNPGFSTKKRGWGLGLSLAKRIIENYHSGKIFIKNSEIGKGTTFRIVLNK